MRRIIFTLSLILVFGNLFSQALIVDFDSTDAVAGAWEGTTQIIDNPKKAGINLSDKACEYTTPANKAWGNAATVVIKEKIIYHLLDSIQFMVLAPSKTKMYVKLENTGGGVPQPECYVTPTDDTNWEMITLKFGGITGNDSLYAILDKIVIFFNVDDNVGGENWVYDKISVYPTAAVESKAKILDFETIPYTLGHWNGISSNELNPKKDGFNTSDSAAKYVTPVNFANSHAAWVLFEDTINYELLDSITFEVYGPSATSLYAKLEDHAKANLEAISYATVTKTNEWERLTLKFSGVSGDDSLYSKYDKITFTFNNNDDGGGEEWYFDNVVVYPPEAIVPVVKDKPTVPGDLFVLSDWDTIMPDWYFNSTTEPELYQISENKGVNNSRAASFTTNTSEYNLIMFNYDDGFKWKEAGNIFKVKVKSPVIGKVGWKFENPDTKASLGGGDILLTKTNEFEEIEFDYDGYVKGWKILNPTDDINKAFTRLIIFVDFYGTEAGNEWIIDDVYAPKGIVSDSYINSIKINTNSIADAGFENIRMYPNPVKDILTIEQDENIRMVEVFNSVGVRVIAEEMNSGIHQVNMSTYASGLYMVRLTGFNGESKAYTVIK